MDDLNFSLVVTLVENKYCTENKCVKKVNTQKNRDLLASKGVDLSLDV